jgi:hypothetical protein
MPWSQPIAPITTPRCRFSAPASFCSLAAFVLAPEFLSLHRTKRAPRSVAAPRACRPGSPSDFAAAPHAGHIARSPRGPALATA